MVDWILLTNAAERLAASDYIAGVTALVEFMHPDHAETIEVDMTIEQLWIAFDILADENDDLSDDLDAANERNVELAAQLSAALAQRDELAARVEWLEHERDSMLWFRGVLDAAMAEIVP
jgi:hypothetical protein